MPMSAPLVWAKDSDPVKPRDFPLTARITERQKPTDALKELAELQSLMHYFRRDKTALTEAGRDPWTNSARLKELAQHVPAGMERCLADEDQFVEIHQQLLVQLRAYLEGQKVNLADRVLKSDRFFDLSSLRSSSPTLTRDGIEEYRWSELGKIQASTSHSKFVSGLKSYREQFKAIEFVDLQTVAVVADAFSRSPNTHDFGKAVLEVRFDLRGTEKSGARRQDRGLLTMGVERDSKTQQWKLSSLGASDFETLKSRRAPMFANVTADRGLAGVEVYDRTEAIRRGGYAIALGDYDGDENLDLFVGQRGPAELYRFNAVTSKFERQAASGLGEDLTYVKAAAFHDFQNRGRQDLFVTRFIRDVGNHDLVLFRADWQKSDSETVDKFSAFKFVPNIMNRHYYSDYAMPMTVADFNRDGFLDLYVGFPGENDFTVLDSSLDKGKTKLAPSGLYFAKPDLAVKDSNKRTYNFIDESLRLREERVSLSKHEIGKRVHYWTRAYPHASLATDFDLDGDMDIAVVDDRQNLTLIYRNEPKTQFVPAQEKIGVGNRGYGMGVASGDLNNDGKIDFAITNVNFTAAERFLKSCQRNWAIYMDGTMDSGMRGLRLFEQGDKGKFAEISVQAGLEWMGEGAGGVEFVDYNNDGRLDIYVVNGLWSGKDRDRDLGSIFAREVSMSQKYLDHLQGRQSMAPSYLDYLRADANFSMAGHQRNRLFRNDGQGRFTEVGFFEGVDSIADGYVVAFADFKKRGRVDLVLRNADPGTMAYTFAPVEIFENSGSTSVSTPRQGVSLKLVGTGRSNRDAVGSRVSAVIEQDGKEVKVVRALNGNNAAAQSERIVHFGLGQAQVAKQVQVTWPDGAVENFGDLKPGYHVLTQGPAQKVSSR